MVYKVPFLVSYLSQFFTCIRAMWSAPALRPASVWA